MKLPSIPSIQDAHLVTHAFCMDGATCCILWEAAGGRRENVHFITAGGMERFVKKDPLVQSRAFLVFADVGLTSGTQADALEKRGECVLMDHHATSQHLSERPWCDVRMDACGSELLRQYLGLEDEHIGRFVQLVDDHDRWLGKEPLSVDLAMWLVFAGQDDFIRRFRALGSGDSPSLFERLYGLGYRNFWSPFERELVGILRHNRDEGIKNALRKSQVLEVEATWSTPIETIDVVCVVTSEQNSSLMLVRALEENPECEVAAQVNIDKGTVSLRSRGDYDVAAMAKHHGGGGHKAAAGFPFPPGFLKEIVIEALL